MIQRRSFIAGILAAGMAPAAIGSGVLMPVRKIIMLGDDPFGQRGHIDAVFGHRAVIRARWAEDEAFYANDEVRDRVLVPLSQRATEAARNRFYRAMMDNIAFTQHPTIYRTPKLQEEVMVSPLPRRTPTCKLIGVVRQSHPVVAAFPKAT